MDAKKCENQLRKYVKSYLCVIIAHLFRLLYLKNVQEIGCGDI